MDTSTNSYIPYEFLNLKDISTSTRNVLLTISTMPDGWFGTVATMATLIKKSTRTVQRAFSELKKKNLVFKEKRLINGVLRDCLFVNRDYIKSLTGEVRVSKMSYCQKGYDNYDLYKKEMGPQYSSSPITLSTKTLNNSTLSSAIVSSKDTITNFLKDKGFYFAKKLDLNLPNLVRQIVVHPMTFLSCQGWQNCRPYIYNKINTKYIYCIDDNFYLTERNSDNKIISTKYIGDVRLLSVFFDLSFEQAYAVAHAVKNKEAYPISYFRDNHYLAKQQDQVVCNTQEPLEQYKPYQQIESTSSQFSSAFQSKADTQAKPSNARCATKLFKPVGRSYDEKGKQTSGFVSIYGDKKKITIDDLKTVLTKHYSLNTDKVEILAQEIYTHFTSRGRNWRWGKGRVTLNNLAQVIYPWIKRDRNNVQHAKFNRIAAEQPISFKAESFVIDSPSVINLKAEKAELSKSTQLNSNNYFVIDYVKRGISAGDLKEFCL